MERRDFAARRNEVYARPGSFGAGERVEKRGPKRDDPDEQRRKMFCGGLSVETSRDTVETYFNRFGPLQEVIMVPDSRTGRPRGFCFIIFQDESSLDLVLSERTHTIDGRNVECTRAVGREEVRNNPGSIRKTKRVYLARTKDLSENEIAEYFEEYIGKELGHVEGVELMKNKETGVHRGFGFVNFSTFEAADKVCSQKDHKIGRQDVVAIKAEPKSERPPERYPQSSAGYDSRRGAGPMMPTGPPSRMIAPALQASLAGRQPSVAAPASQSVADLRRLEEEIMIREEQLRIKEMKLQLQSARMAAGTGGEPVMSRGAASSAIMERPMMSASGAGGGYGDRMVGPPQMVVQHSSSGGVYGSGGQLVEDYVDTRRAQSSMAGIVGAGGGGGGPMRSRDRYVSMMPEDADQGYPSRGSGMVSSGGYQSVMPSDAVYYGGSSSGGGGYY